MKIKNNLLSVILYLLALWQIDAQNDRNFVYTKGGNNVAAVSIEENSRAKCTVIEFPEYIVLIDVPNTPYTATDSLKMDNPKYNPLIEFLDSIYINKPIKYVLNTHSHGHSISRPKSFIENGAKLVTAKENIEYYDKLGLFGDKKSTGYREAIIQISADTTLLGNTDNPIEIIHLKKSDYRYIPTKAFLFFNFPKQKILAASCMLDLKDLNKSYGYKGFLYSSRLPEFKNIIEDKNLSFDYTLQLRGLSRKNGADMPAMYTYSHFKNSLKQGWSRDALSEHFVNMSSKLSYNELKLKQDSILQFHIVNDINALPLNRAVYGLIDKKEYEKAVLLGQTALLYRPDFNSYLVNTLGEAYYIKGDLNKAKHYDYLLKRIDPDNKKVGLAVWQKAENKI